ncbi:MAG: TerD family protein [Spirochaetaceae bacterium]|jgi:tellurite resistance protein TerA|nr:TerD family protein [Spirochaetaceae bacterium]
MITMPRGFKAKLEAGGVDSGQPVQVWTAIAGNGRYDTACFGLTEADRIQDDRYVVFFNQTAAPEGGISLIEETPQGSTFQANLGSLPAFIQKLAFTAAVDGPVSMRDIQSGEVRLMQNGRTAFTLAFTGADFQNQKAIITIEIYRKSGSWRVAAVADGFNFSGGLDKLMAHFGVEVRDSESAPAPRSAGSAQALPETPAQAQPDQAARQAHAAGKNAEGFDRADDDWV